MEVKPGYKMTEVGVIPEDWEVTRLSSLVSSGPKNGYSGRSGKDARGTPTLTLTATTSGRFILDDETVKFLNETIDIHSDLLLKTGDVLVQRSNTLELVGTTAIFEGLSGVYAYPDLMMRLRFKAIENAHWFWRYANSSGGRIYFVSVAAGSTGTMPKLTGMKLRNMPLPLPSLPEQRAIAATLSDVDALLDGLDRLIAKKRDLKQAAMQQLLTGKTRLPGFSGEWEVKKLGNHVTFLRNGVNSRDELIPYGNVKYLHYGDIHACKGIYLSPETMPAIPDVKTTRLERLQNGDLILVDASEDLAGVGKSVEMREIGDIKVVSGQHTIAARFDKAVLADGFKGYLQFCPPFSMYLRRLVAGTKVYATKRSYIASVEMNIPSVIEQRAIATILSDMDAEIAALQTRRDKTRDLKEAMMQELLTGRTRLIDPTNKTEHDAKGMKP